MTDFRTPGRERSRLRSENRGSHMRPLQAKIAGGNDPAADRLKGADFAQRALKIAGDDPEVIVNAALALSYFGEDIDAMIALVDRALAWFSVAA